MMTIVFSRDNTHGNKVYVTLWGKDFTIQFIAKYDYRGIKWSTLSCNGYVKIVSKQMRREIAAQFRVWRQS